jgi:hypothetical protein
MPVRRLELAAKNVEIVWRKIEMLLAIDLGTSYLIVIK